MVWVQAAEEFLSAGSKRILLILMAVIFSAEWVSAQKNITQYTILYSFTNSPDGAYPYSGLTEAWSVPGELPGLGGTLYGATTGGGFSQNADPNHHGNPNGTLYEISPSGRFYSVIYNFDSAPYDGSNPMGSLTRMGTSLYGTCQQGSCGPEDNGGTVFEMDYPYTATNYGTLYSFWGTYGTHHDGQSPWGGVVAAGGNLYGPALNDGDNTGEPAGTVPAGIVFSFDFNPVDYTILHTFNQTPTSNGDGANPYSGLTVGSPIYGPLSGLGQYAYTNYTLYGTTSGGGTGGSGIVFSIDSNGSNYTILHNFCDGSVTNDGNYPLASLTLVGDTLYGTTVYGGSYSYRGETGGTVFEIKTNGSGYAILHSFSNNRTYDGGHPVGPVTLFSNVLYGTTEGGDGVDNGVLFKMNLDGSGFSVVHSFAGQPSDGACPYCALTVFQNIYGSYLYGTTVYGGVYNCGTIFAMPLATNNLQAMPIAVLSPTNGSTLYFGTNVSIAADVSSITGAVSRVDFYSGQTYLGSMTNSPYSFTWTNATAGTNVITVVAISTNGVALAASDETIIYLPPPPVITTVVGNYGLGGGYSGDGGAATNARLNAPQGVIADSLGNIYITDNGNNVVRKVGTNGIITTVAGKHSLGGTYSGNGGAATNAGLYGPCGLDVDNAGDLYFVENGNNVVCKVDTNGIITTVAGNHSLGGGYSGDGGAATNAALNGPCGLALDVVGDIFIADTANGVIRMVDTNGVISTVAGNHAYNRGYSGDGGAATDAGMNWPVGVALDALGNLYISEYFGGVVRKVDTSGIITTVAGNHAFGLGYSGDGGSATNAMINLPLLLAVDNFNNLYISDDGNSLIRKVDSNGIITTVAGNYSLRGGYSGDGGAATNAALSYPVGISFDPVGDFLITDQNNNVIRKVSF